MSKLKYKKIPGFEDLYATKCGKIFQGPNRLKLHIDKNKYVRVCYNNENLYANRLIMMAFNENFKNTYDVHHKNNIITDLSYDNLYCTTRSETKLMGKANAGTNRPASKLSEKDLTAILERFYDGESIRSISYDFQISYNNLQLICSGKTYKNFDRTKIKNYNNINS